MNLHTHKCSQCGMVRTCSKSPCKFRPMDEQYVCCYEPPLVSKPDALAASWRIAGRLATGVRGTAYEQDGLIYIPMIAAEREGNGDVGRFLDSLSVRCRIVDVVNLQLAGMLSRRSWQQEGVVWSRPDNL